MDTLRTSSAKRPPARFARELLLAAYVIALVVAANADVRARPAASSPHVVNRAAAPAQVHTYALVPGGAHIALPQSAPFAARIDYGPNDAGRGTSVAVSAAAVRGSFYVEIRLNGTTGVTLPGEGFMSLRSPSLSPGVNYRVSRYAAGRRVERSYSAGTSVNGTLTFRSPLAKTYLAPGTPLLVVVSPAHPRGIVWNPPPPVSYTPTPTPTPTFTPPPTATPSSSPTPTSSPSPTPTPAGNPITHVVVIVQENRTVEDLFHFLPGADTVSYGLNHFGQQVPLVEQSLAAPCKPPHGHGAFVTEYNNGNMNGFDLVDCTSGGTLYAYAPSKEVAIYLTLAGTYGFANHVLQMNGGPSFPSHQFLIAGQSGGIGPYGQFENQPYGFSENGGTKSGNDKNKGSATSCGAPLGNRVTQIDLTSAYPGNENFKAYPCYEANTIFDLLAANGLTWRYYSNKPGGLWSGPQAIQHLYNSPNFTVGGAQFFADIAAGKLANVTYIMPNQAWSDHPQPHYKATNGPNWVGDLVNAVGESPFWDSTEILVTWDDWGGFYDHYDPGTLLSGITPYSYGFRVPVVVASAYTPSGCIDPSNTSQGAILRNIERIFALPSLHTADSWTTDDFSSCLNFSQAARTFVPLATTKPPSYFEKRGDSSEIEP